MEPYTDVEVKVSSRKLFENGQWVYGIEDFKSVFAMFAGDDVTQSIDHETSVSFYMDRWYYKFG